VIDEPATTDLMTWYIMGALSGFGFLTFWLGWFVGRFSFKQQIASFWRDAEWGDAPEKKIDRRTEADYDRWAAWIEEQERFEIQGEDHGQEEG
jgi:hypothetical protein